MDRAAEAALLYAPAVIAVGFVVVGYFFVALERVRGASDDPQAGLKLVLYAFVLAGVQLAAEGARDLLAYVLGGFRGGSMPIREAIPPVLVGGLAAFGVMRMLLPRTNAVVAKRPERLALGALATLHGALALVGLSGFVSGVFKGSAWSLTSSSMAVSIVSGAIAYLAVTRLGAQSSWTMPPRPQNPNPYPPADWPQQQ